MYKTGTVSGRNVDIGRLIEFTVDYYDVLGLTRDQVPCGSTREERMAASATLDRAYRAMCRRFHPDFHPEELREEMEGKFKSVVRAHTILSHPLWRRVYDAGGAEDLPRTVEFDGKRMEVDWDHLGNYAAGTSADSVGYGLFFAVCERADELRIVPAFHPSGPEHNYEWDWVVRRDSSDDRPVKMALSLVPDEDDVLRLTSGVDVETSLPFKIYVCLPRAFVHFLRAESEVYEVRGKSVEYKGAPQVAQYVDLELLETTDLSVAHDFLCGDGLSVALDRFRSGELEQEQRERDRASGSLNWVGTDAVKKVDADVLKSVLRIKTSQTQYDPHAADFLERLKTAR